MLVLKSKTFNFQFTKKITKQPRSFCLEPFPKRNPTFALFVLRGIEGKGTVGLIPHEELIACSIYYSVLSCPKRCKTSRMSSAGGVWVRRIKRGMFFLSVAWTLLSRARNGSSHSRTVFVSPPTETR